MPPPLREFVLDGSCGWSRSCKHEGPCRCPRTPVSPWASWGREAWDAFNNQLEAQWRLRAVDGCEVAVHHITVVVYHLDHVGWPSVLKLWRDASAGGHFSGWSVPGGSVARGRDCNIHDAARREWDEEMLGYPWREVVGELPDNWQEDVVAGCHVYRAGRFMLCAATLGEISVATSRHGGELRSMGPSLRSTATLYAPATAAFHRCTSGSAMPLRPPRHHVTKATLRELGRKIHTEGWLFVEHSGEAHWMPWNSAGEDDAGGAAVFPNQACGHIILPALQAVCGWHADGAAQH